MRENWSKTMWGVYADDGYPVECFGLFHRIEDAEEWAAERGCSCAIIETSVEASYSAGVGDFPAKGGE